jgi:hypothetical protein
MPTRYQIKQKPKIQKTKYLPFVEEKIHAINRLPIILQNPLGGFEKRCILAQKTLLKVVEGSACLFQL